MNLPDQLCLAKADLTALHRLAARPPHAILLTGPEGTATDRAGAILAGSGVTYRLGAEADLGVDTIRNLVNLARARRRHPLVVLIDPADHLTIPAQHAFLKLLEEPTPGIRYLLVTTRPDALLPTVHSRLSHWSLRPVTAATSAALLDHLTIHDPTRRAQLLFAAEGLPQRLYHLATDQAAFDRYADQVRTARRLLDGDPAALADLWACQVDRTAALSLLTIIGNLVEQALLSQPRRHTLTRLQRITQARQRIVANGHIRLNLLAAVL